MTHPSLEERLCGALFGSALGDALGLALEGLDADTIARRFGDPVERFHLVAGRGFVSDDTEQLALVAEAMARAGRDPDAVVRAFRRALRAWFLRLPFGIGGATLRACLRLCLGVKRSGVCSAGNGAAMRAGVVGVHLRDDAALRRRLAPALARVTHTDLRAVEAAVFVAELAAACARAATDVDRAELVATASEVVTHRELRAALDEACALARAPVAPALAAVVARLGNTGFVVHTLGLAAYVFLCDGDDPLRCMQRAIAAGGDTDTLAAIVGGWAGALHGSRALPPALVAALAPGPFGPRHLRSLAAALARGTAPPAWSASAALLRNLALYPVVLFHGLARVWSAASGMILQQR